MNIETFRHSVSHLLAAAIMELYPGTKLGIGPSIENGFYYDFDFAERITPEDLPKIEKKMKEIASRNFPFTRKEIPPEEAIKFFIQHQQPYKVELIKELRDSALEKIPFVSIYETGKFVDLCQGPHVFSTAEIKTFKLLKIAGAYWRGKETNPQLTRIYGTAFFTQKELDDYLNLLKQAEERDHRTIGQNLDLFSFSPLVGAGLPLWHPKGALLRQIIEDFWIREHLQNGYDLVRTPHIGNLKLWQTSGHWEFYQDSMYSPIDIEKEKYLLKPMNCPFHVQIYQTQMRSYRDLPFRWAELGTVYRYERSGVLHGLTRVRGFTQDDAHIICTPEQLPEEIGRAIKFAVRLLKIFGFKNYEIYLSTRPEKYVGAKEMWDKATKILEHVLEKAKLKYQVDPGEGVFYGPKVDIKIKDSLGRAWQCTTVQFDFNLPQRFQMEYIDKDGKKKQPFMVHRALLGSMERFVGILLEHYAGNLPIWLSPEQIRIISVGSAHLKPAKKLQKELNEAGVRTFLDDVKETVGYKIRKAEKQKIPYMLVIGDKEAKGKILTVRVRGKKKMLKINRKEFLERIQKEMTNKK